MKRIAVLLFILHSSFFALHSSAQIRFGYLSYDSVLRQMPEYAQMQQSLATLKEKYDQEATRGENEFQRKFSEFLQGQKDFPENILVKRQAELQALMENGIKFRQEAQTLLSKAETEMLGTMKEKLNEVIRSVGMECGYAYILNTDGDACPFIQPTIGEDVTVPVLKKLGLVEEEPETFTNPAGPEGEVLSISTTEETTAPANALP